jgi:ribonuclease P/MRP protein subunit RPP40
MPSIFDFASNDAVDPKMHVSHGLLPPYIDAGQPPTKRSPWCQIQKISFIHTLTMLMPDEMYEIIWNALDAEVKKIKYAKVIMKLQEVLEGDFFTEYIKKGMSAFTYEYCLVNLSLPFDDMLSF